jgi:hypothetical protein
MSAERSWQESVDLDRVRERPAKRVKAEEGFEEAVKVEDLPNAASCRVACVTHATARKAVIIEAEEELEEAVKVEYYT